MQIASRSNMNMIDSVAPNDPVTVLLHRLHGAEDVGRWGDSCGSCKSQRIVYGTEVTCSVSSS